MYLKEQTLAYDLIRTSVKPSAKCKWHWQTVYDTEWHL